MADTKYLAGGANFVDLMREIVERPTSLVDVTSLSTSIEKYGEERGQQIEADLGRFVVDLELHRISGEYGRLGRDEAGF